MARLTFEGDFCDIAGCLETRGGSFCEDGACSQRKTWERLKYYEDLEEQGRLVMLPNKAMRLKVAYQKQGDKLIEYVPVVRCKDCKHMVSAPLGRYCLVWQGHNGAEDEGFCNYGERKDHEIN